MPNTLICNSLTYFSNLFFKNGMMFVYFHSKGTSHSFNDTLNTLASGILICSTVSISSFGGIPFISCDFNFLATISGVTINCLKLFYLAIWNLAYGTGNILYNKILSGKHWTEVSIYVFRH